MSDKQNILIVHNYYQIAGGEDTVVANEKKMLSDNGHRVTMYNRSNSELKNMGKLSKLFLPLTTIYNPRTFKEVKKIIKENNIDIVHVHNTLNLISPSVYYAAHSMKVPVVQTIHNFRFVCPAATFYRDKHICEDCIDKGLNCALKHNCYRNSKLQTLACVLSTKIHRILGTYQKNNYICLTEFTKNKLLSANKPGKKNIFLSEKFYIKPNFTYENSIPRKDGTHFLFIGRIEEIKGIDILINAFSELPDEKLIIAGTGNDFNKYKNIVNEKNLTNITFTGFLQRDELDSILSEAKAVIVTSQWYETFGMIIAEAFASHVPVITGDIGNIGGLVTEGVTGFKFKYDSALSLCEAIKKFNAHDAKMLSDNAYNEYLDKYSDEINYKTLKKIYDDISK